MKKKIIVIAVIAVLAACGFFFFSNQEEKEEKPAAETVQKDLESYDSSDDTITYKYLTKTGLRSNGAFLNAWIISSDDIVKKTNSASSEKDGVRMDLRVYGKKKGVQTGDVLEAEFKKQCRKVDKISNARDIDIQDAVRGKNYWLQEIDYTIYGKKNKIYPCVVFIKIDELTDGNFLKSVITIDNSKGNKETAKVLAEVLDAYGIELK